MTGGRIGKDGIHGATFSSEELHEGSPVTAVQIGDPITQKKMTDFLLIARDRGLYRAITDNGAGGLSSSVGETARLSGGCEIDLKKAPLKYPGLNPWEILISESQERMTLAVAPETIDEFLDLARKMDVEATVLGRYTDSGWFHIRYGEETVVYVDMDFLHDGLPQMTLQAAWTPPRHEEPAFPEPADLGEALKAMLSRLNICSKESVVRQYDHEVQGGSVVKPLTGAANDGPSDAAVIRPLLDSFEGIVDRQRHLPPLQRHRRLPHGRLRHRRGRPERDRRRGRRSTAWRDSTTSAGATRSGRRRPPTANTSSPSSSGRTRPSTTSRPPTASPASRGRTA